MKRPLQLPLAIALALGGTNALALGLGPVHVNSKLNQPLDAEIPVLQGSAGEAEGLLVNLAAAEDFDRIGLNRSRLNVPLEFSLGKNAKGEPVIKVTSKEPVRDSFLDFLVEANWPKGRLLREYTILLDPPVTAPATARAATTTPMPASPGTVTLTKRERPAPAEKTQAAAAPAAPRAAKPAAAPAPAAKAGDGQYGPVEAGQTLSEVAHSVGEGRNVNQMMLALWKSNPNAFYKDNINALKRGAILRIPSADEVKAIGSATEAASQVQSQVEDWRGGRASPTLVADAGKPAAAPAAAPPKKTATTASATPGKSSSERLELVPPKAGKDSMAMADRPGGGGAGSAASTELKSELARTKEALTAREQETGELKSRVKELEDLKGKNDRLIGLKDSEIAELQQKLKQIQDGKATSVTPAKTSTATSAAAPAAAAAAAGSAASSTTSPTTPSDKISKQDIWGEAGTGKTTPVADAGKPATSPSTTTPSATTPATSSSSTPVPLAPTPATTASSSPSSTPTTPAASTTGTASTPAGTSSSTPAPAAGTTPAAGSSTSTPSTTPATTTPGTTTPAAPAKPAAATPAKPVAKPKPAPQPEPWYSASWVMPAALGGTALVLLLGFFGLRKRKAAPVDTGRGSIAGAFGDSPFGAPGDAALNVHEAEEAKLRELLQHDPHNVGLHLELLSLYYAERDIAKFEYAAADMHGYVTDPHQPEWLEAQAMGQELAPHNPLFASAAHYDEADSAFGNAATTQHAHLHEDDAFATPAYRNELPPPPHTPDHLDSDLGFDLDDTHLGTPPATPAHAAAKHESFDFDLPPLDLDTPPPVQPAHNGHDLHAHTPAAAPPAARLDDDYFPGEDAVGTKLDLAKAYMDMGDPEGARSMLEEVVSEGSDAQKAEAHRLMAEIR